MCHFDTIDVALLYVYCYEISSFSETGDIVIAALDLDVINDYLHNICLPTFPLDNSQIWELMMGMHHNIGRYVENIDPTELTIRSGNIFYYLDIGEEAVDA
jgi:hypothetical protein